MTNGLEWYLKGMSFQAEHVDDEAVLSFDYSLLWEPSNAGAWRRRGISLSVLGFFDEAIRSIGQALTRDPNNSVI